MKHLQKFPLINESRSQAIDENKFKEILKTKCSNWNIEHQRIYRGVQYNKDNFLYINPEEHDRPSKSQGGKNIYSIILDNGVSWQRFPDRKKSIICSNNIGVAAEFSGEDDEEGDPLVHVVIPFNNTEWAICPGNDIWHSFKDLGLDNLQEFNSIISGVIFKLSKVSVSEIKYGIDTYDDIKYFLSKIDFSDIKHINKVLGDTILHLLSYDRSHVDSGDSIIISLLNKFKKVSNPDEMSEIIINSLKPDGFEIQTYGKQGIRFDKKEQECWSDGEALLIRKDVFDKMFNL